MVAAVVVAAVVVAAVVVAAVVDAAVVDVAAVVAAAVVAAVANLVRWQDVLPVTCVTVVQLVELRPRELRLVTLCLVMRLLATLQRQFRHLLEWSKDQSLLMALRRAAVV